MWRREWEVYAPSSFECRGVGAEGVVSSLANPLVAEAGEDC